MPRSSRLGKPQPLARSTTPRSVGGCGTTSSAPSGCAEDGTGAAFDMDATELLERCIARSEASGRRIADRLLRLASHTANLMELAMSRASSPTFSGVVAHGGGPAAVAAHGTRSSLARRTFTSPSMLCPATLTLRLHSSAGSGGTSLLRSPRSAPRPIRRVSRRHDDVDVPQNRVRLDGDVVGKRARAREVDCDVAATSSGSTSHVAARLPIRPPSNNGWRPTSHRRVVLGAPPTGRSAIEFRSLSCRRPIRPAASRRPACAIWSLRR